MASKRKTLPNDFENLLKAGTQEDLEKAMQKCVPNATGGYYKHNAFGFKGISEAFATWLVDYGTDINMQDNYGYTPLHHQAMRHDGYKQMECYICLGADVNLQSTLNGGPLHGALDRGCTENVRLLLVNGADIQVRTNTKNPAGGYTALEFALSRCRGADVAEKIKAIAVLIEAGAAVTDKVKKEAERIGAGVEFYRADMKEDRIIIVDAALNRLYELTGVEPAAKRRMHDGVSPITATASTWQEQYKELWEYLVPGMGACQTVQGEAIRVSGRVSDELLGIGGANWDNDYRMMLDCLQGYVEMGVSLHGAGLDELKTLLSGIRNGVANEDVLQRLKQLCGMGRSTT